MHPSHLKSLARRAFLRRAGQLGLAGVATPWALNLAAIGEAAAFDATDYKALVCVFLYGGNDHGNTVIPVDAVNYPLYANIRQTLATPLASLGATTLVPDTPLGGGMQMALAPEMTALKELFDAGRMAVQLNVGPLVVPTTKTQYNAKSVPLPPKLFSHNDQQSIWQSSSPEGSTRGWGGTLGDIALSSNGSATFTCISVTGNAVFLAGQVAIPYQVSTSGAVAITPVKSGLYGSRTAGTALGQLMAQADGHVLANEYARVTARSIQSEGTITSALAGSAALSTVFPTTGLGPQLKVAAQLIGARAALGVKRQVFLVSLGGFDLHDNLIDQHPALLAGVSDAMKAFYDATVELGVANNVTAFTASDFGRTLSSNGDGSDHGWGAHHFVVGGAVQGRQFYGLAPAVAVDGPDDVRQGRLLPTTSVDQYAATMARWFGVSDSELAAVLPNIGNFNQRTLTFL